MRRPVKRLGAPIPLCEVGGFPGAAAPQHGIVRCTARVRTSLPPVQTLEPVIP
jgi:hypothetical protein